MDLGIQEMNVYIYPTPLLWAGYDTKLIFKLSKAGLNSVFFLDWLLYDN